MNEMQALMDQKDSENKLLQKRVKFLEEKDDFAWLITYFIIIIAIEYY